jgi:hypothetical protein
MEQLLAHPSSLIQNLLSLNLKVFINHHFLHNMGESVFSTIRQQFQIIKLKTLIQMRLKKI